MKNLIKESEKAKVKFLKASEKYFKSNDILPVYFIEWKYQDETEYTKTYFIKEEDAKKVKARFESNPDIEVKNFDNIAILSPIWYL